MLRQEDVSQVEERSMRNKIDKPYQDGISESVGNHESAFVRELKVFKKKKNCNCIKIGEA